MSDRTVIMVKFTAEGFHQWPEAPAGRAYLAALHRHLFHVTIEITVHHHDREVEFHDLLERCREVWLENGPYFEHRSSCEDIATRYIDRLEQWYPGRAYSVQVWEDDEVGAQVTRVPEVTQ